MDERFWSKVQKTPTCWLWTGAPSSNKGYGSYGKKLPDGRFRTVLAHRYAWEQMNGPLPPGMCALHSCDNPPCVNPAHLFKGTKKDNAIDRERKKRGNQPRHETHNKAKLSEEDAAEIRHLKSRISYTNQELADLFRVDKSTISRVLRRETWV